MKNILLGILPYWAPVLPPVGLARLKRFLGDHGYRVKVADLIVKNETLEFYYGYFDVLNRCIPEENKGNFKNIGHDVLQNHMTAHWNHTDKKAYHELVSELIYKTYYVRVEESHILELDRVIGKYYDILWQYFSYLLTLDKPDVLGLTVYRDTLAASLFILKRTREQFPHIKTVVGGGLFADTHGVGTPNFQRLLEVTEGYLDKIMIGEGELLMLEYLRGALPADRRVYTVDDVGGKYLDLRGAPPPDFSDLNMRKYSHLPGTASFSCLYNCSFCNEIKFRGPYRKRDIHDAVDEMTALNSAVELNNVNSGHQLFFMTDSLINPVLPALADELLKRNVSLYYDGYYKVDNAAADTGNTFTWRKSGLYRVRLGVESGSQHILNLMRKGITVEQIRKAVTGFALAGIKTTTYWVIGHPGESEADFQMTLDLVEELKNSIYQAECNPFLYHYSGQNSSDQWQKHRKLLYPESARDMLLFDSWTLEMEPPREEAYHRMNRFVAHCKKLGIPNPYSLKESFDADRRWQKLQKFAVPPMDQFNEEGARIDDNLKNRRFAATTATYDGDFDI